MWHGSVVVLCWMYSIDMWMSDSWEIGGVPWKCEVQCDVCLAVNTVKLLCIKFTIRSCCGLTPVFMFLVHGPWVMASAATVTGKGDLAHGLWFKFFSMIRSMSELPKRLVLTLNFRVLAYSRSPKLGHTECTYTCGMHYGSATTTVVSVVIYIT